LSPSDGYRGSEVPRKANVRALGSRAGGGVFGQRPEEV